MVLSLATGTYSVQFINERNINLHVLNLSAVISGQIQLWEYLSRTADFSCCQSNGLVRDVSPQGAIELTLAH